MFKVENDKLLIKILKNTSIFYRQYVDVVFFRTVCRDGDGDYHRQCDQQSYCRDVNCAIGSETLKEIFDFFVFHLTILPFFFTFQPMNIGSLSFFC